MQFSCAHTQLRPRALASFLYARHEILQAARQACLVTRLRSSEGVTDHAHFTIFESVLIQKRASSTQSSIVSRRASNFMQLRHHRRFYRPEKEKGGCSSHLRMQNIAFDPTAGRSLARAAARHHHRPVAGRAEGGGAGHFLALAAARHRPRPAAGRAAGGGAGRFLAPAASLHRPRPAAGRAGGGGAGRFLGPAAAWHRHRPAAGRAGGGGAGRCSRFSAVRHIRHRAATRLRWPNCSVWSSRCWVLGPLWASRDCMRLGRGSGCAGAPAAQRLANRRRCRVSLGASTHEGLCASFARPRSRSVSAALGAPEASSGRGRGGGARGLTARAAACLAAALHRAAACRGLTRGTGTVRFLARRRRAVPLTRHWMRYVDAGMGWADNALCGRCRCAMVLRFAGVEASKSFRRPVWREHCARYGASELRCPAGHRDPSCCPPAARGPGFRALPRGSRRCQPWRSTSLFSRRAAPSADFSDGHSFAPHPLPLLFLHLFPVNPPSRFSTRPPHPDLPPGRPAHQARYGSLYYHAAV